MAPLLLPSVLSSAHPHRHPAEPPSPTLSCTSADPAGPPAPPAPQKAAPCPELVSLGAASCPTLLWSTGHPGVPSVGVLSATAVPHLTQPPAWHHPRSPSSPGAARPQGPSCPPGISPQTGGGCPPIKPVDSAEGFSSFNGFSLSMYSVGYTPKLAVGARAARRPGRAVILPPGRGSGPSCAGTGLEAPLSASISQGPAGSGAGLVPVTALRGGGAREGLCSAVNVPGGGGGVVLPSIPAPRCSPL